MSDNISISVNETIQHIQICRADKMNAFTDEMYQSVATALKKSHKADGIKVNLISGVPGCFTAGNDISDFYTYAEKGNFSPGIIDFLTTLGTLDMPLILAIDGPAIGIGTTMAFHADLVYATPEAIFATPFADLGLTPEAASSYLMPKTMGHARAYEMLALGEKYSAKDACRAGFVNKIIPSDELISHSLNIAKKLSKKPESSLLATKQLLKTEQEYILTVMEKEVEIFTKQLQSKEAKAAFSSFLNKTK
ncbi:MAG: enoyl-CoA hydratase [Methyloligella sp.]|nr:MAG: enoyl-CoA hydratase [Methyloligella sp.]